MIERSNASGASLNQSSIATIEKLAHRSSSAVAVVVNTGDANSYGVIVNLGQAGVPVLSVISDEKNITSFSRYAAVISAPDHRESEENFIDFLLDVGARLKPRPVLFVNGDEQLMVLLKYREKIDTVFSFPYAPYALAEPLVNKTSFYRMLRKYSAPHAETFFPESIDDVEGLCQVLDYPYILKPAQSQLLSERFGNKCIRVTSSDELLDQYKKIEPVVGRMILQKEMAGTERYLVYTYFSGDSIPLGVCCYRKVRIFPTDFGNACVCETVTEKDAIELCIGLLKKIGYRGFAEAEIQRDTNDGILKLVEINARTTTQSRLPARCGVNMEHIAYRDALGHKQQPLVNQELGILWIDLFRDFLSVFSPDGYLKQNKITVRGWLASLSGRRVFAYITWNDPMPAIVHYSRQLRMYVFNKRILTKVRNAFGAIARK